MDEPITNNALEEEYLKYFEQFFEGRAPRELSLIFYEHWIRTQLLLGLIELKYGKESILYFRMKKKIYLEFFAMFHGLIVKMEA
jgi:hypothetical protein